MRLIDADALIEQFDERPYNWTDSPEEIQAVLDWEIAIDNINKAPTVNAITVEWLEEQADYARSEWDYDTCEGIRIVLKAW